MVSPGILCTLMSCHANWAVRTTLPCFPQACALTRSATILTRTHAFQSSLALMDKAILPRPPLMVASRLAVDFGKEFAPPNMPLTLTSRVMNVQDSAEPYTVEIAVQLRAKVDEGDDAAPLYASGVATFQKIGAVRSLIS